ncbi:MAG: glycosyltransferase family 4 protein, partial [Candidatus Peribacteraceae bacterium]
TQVTVIAQCVGKHALPKNVHIHSLGKEEGLPRWRQILRFWKLQWSLRGEYDAVFVHMTPIWVLLGCVLWKILRKRMYLWYEIRRGSWRLSAALLCVRTVFTATQHGLPRSSRKQKVVGHGIDLHTYIPNSSLREPGIIVAAGRITRSKHYDVILHAFAQLPQDCRLLIAGGIITPHDTAEHERLQLLMRDRAITDRVIIQWVPPAEMPSLLCRADLLLHACIGGLDKIVLEAMACGCPVVSSSPATREILPGQCVATEANMAEKARAILAMKHDERDAFAADLRHRVEQNHNLTVLISTLVYDMQ